MGATGDGSGNFYLNPNVQSGYSGAAFFINRSGNVGIGTVTPYSSAKLDVAGNAKVSSNCRCGQNFNRNIATNEWSWWGRRYAGNLPATVLSLFTYYYDVDEAPIQTTMFMLTLLTQLVIWVKTFGAMFMIIMLFSRPIFMLTANLLLLIQL